MLPELSWIELLRPKERVGRSNRSGSAIYFQGFESLPDHHFSMKNNPHLAVHLKSQIPGITAVWFEEDLKDEILSNPTSA